jgi:hypothetical protein
MPAPAPEAPHPSVWTVNLITLSVVLFSVSFGVGMQVIQANRTREVAEENALREPARRRGSRRR